MPGHAHGRHEPVCRVNIGEVAASRDPLRLETVLGSCISVCLFDPTTMTGGMNHILVPSSHSDCQGTARCGIQAMELLINALMKLGADRRRLVAKAFGGANVLPYFRTPTVGDLNAKFVRQFLATERIPLLAERMGGIQAVRAVFHAHSGRAFVHTLDGTRLPRIVREEILYYNIGPGERFPEEEPVVF
jgi:chemotaxis protein CheD